MKINTTIRKRFRVSNKVKKVSSNDRFRLSISRSSKNISAQIIDSLFFQFVSLHNFTILSAPRIKHGVVVQTCTKCFPTGAKLNIV